MNDTPELDAFDRRILTILQQEARLPMVELAERIALSATPTQRRVKRLEEAGLIQGYAARLDRRALGLGLTVFMEIKVDGHRDKNASALQAFLLKRPEVVACHIVSGEADFLVEVTVPDLASYEELLLGTFLKLPMIKDIRSNFSIRAIKVEGPLPVGTTGD